MRLEELLSYASQLLRDAVDWLTSELPGMLGELSLPYPWLLVVSGVALLTVGKDLARGLGLVLLILSALSLLGAL